ncbi:MAG: substrate-binding domain-containing protein [Acidiferrobacterales bacterium]
MRKTVGLCLLFFASAAAQAQLPAITGQPYIDSPKLLYWPRDFVSSGPDLTTPTANELNDLHGSVGQCDLVVSSEGNYHMALHELWMQYLKDYPNDGSTRMYTTSPPVSPGQISGGVTFGNLKVTCPPQIAVGSMKVMAKLQGLGALDGPPVALYANYGDVILVKKGNPKHIHTVWDLGRPDVRLVTPNPTLEPGAFSNYATTIYEVAALDPNPPSGMTADKLFNSIFNSASPDRDGLRDSDRDADIPKWLAGARIHHRDEPWSIAYGHADAGVILYHLAKYIKATFPDQFDIVPIGGTVDNPQPLPGNVTGTTYIAKLNGPWTQQQLDARDHVWNEYMSYSFTQMLDQNGLKRP